jgi:hypothetical protein
MKTILTLLLLASFPALAANPTVLFSDALDASATHCIFNVQKVPPAVPPAPETTLPVVAANAVQPMAGNHCQMTLVGMAVGNYSATAKAKNPTETSAPSAPPVLFTIAPPLAPPPNMRVVTE